MYWTIDQYGLPFVASQLLPPIEWAVAFGLAAMFAYGCAVAWRGRHGRCDGTAESSPSERRIPEEFVLTDEEQVLRLLDSNGGRMRQRRIVEATDWSKSKVSMLLSEMEIDGSITKLRLGRENVIIRAGFEPDAMGSPFEAGA